MAPNFTKAIGTDILAPIIVAIANNEVSATACAMDLINLPKFAAVKDALEDHAACGPLDLIPLDDDDTNDERQRKVAANDSIQKRRNKVNRWLGRNKDDAEIIKNARIATGDATLATSPTNSTSTSSSSGSTVKRVATSAKKKASSAKKKAKKKVKEIASSAEKAAAKARESAGDLKDFGKYIMTQLFDVTTRQNAESIARQERNNKEWNARQAKKDEQYDKEFARTNKHLRGMGDRVDTLEKKQGNLENRQGNLENRQGNLEKRQDEQGQQIDDVQQRTTMLHSAVELLLTGRKPKKPKKKNQAQGLTEHLYGGQDQGVSPDPKSSSTVSSSSTDFLPSFHRHGSPESFHSAIGNLMGAEEEKEEEKEEVEVTFDDGELYGKTN